VGGRKICAALGVCVSVWDGVYMNETCMGFIPWQEANSRPFQLPSSILSN
jgi:hypothetical protein